MNCLYSLRAVRFTAPTLEGCCCYVPLLSFVLYRFFVELEFLVINWWGWFLCWTCDSAPSNTLLLGFDEAAWICLIWALAWASKFELIFDCVVLLSKFFEDEDLDPLLEFLGNANTDCYTVPCGCLLYLLLRLLLEPCFCKGCCWLLLLGVDWIYWGWGWEVW